MARPEIDTHPHIFRFGYNSATMRRVSLLLLFQFVVQPALLPQSTAVKPGSIISRWPIKTSLQPNTVIAKAGTLIPIADLLALDPAAEKMSKPFEDALFPKIHGALFSDGQIIRTRGYLRIVAGEPDGDYHVQLTATPDTMENSVVVEVPKDDAEFVSSAELRDAVKTVRQWIVTNLRTGDPTGRVVHIVHPVYVEVQGQLFFDAEHQSALDKGVFRGKSIDHVQLPSKTCWEIHPVTSVIFVTKPT
jgi:hypothetical protein